MPTTSCITAGDFDARRGDRLLAVGKFADAVAAFEAAVRLAPDHRHHRGGLLQALAQLGDIDRLRSAVTHLVTTWPDCNITRLAAARALGLVGDSAESALHYRETRFLRPLDGEILVEFSAALIDDGAVREAIELLQHRLRDDPDDLAANFHLGRAWAALGEQEAAAFRFRRCLEIAPDDSLGAAAHLAVSAGGLVPDLPAAFVRCLFDQYAEHFDEALRVRLRYRGPEIVWEMVAEVLGEDLTPRDILDLGCGTGLAAPLFRPLALSLAGVDLSPAMLAKARERGLYDHLEVGEAVAFLRESAAAWDLIIAVDVLVYIGDLAPLLMAAAAALRPGGFLAATVETGAADGYEFQPTKRFRHHPDYVRRIVAEAGLTLTFGGPVVLRQERNQPVDTFLFMARRC